MYYWFELLDEKYRETEYCIPDGTIAEAKKYAIEHMKKNRMIKAHLKKYSLRTSKLLEIIHIKLT